MIALILAYHRVNDRVEDPLAVRAADFRRQLEAVRRSYEVIALGRLADLLEKPPAGRRVAAITFDDGYRDNFEVAAPVLEELSLPATFFLAAACLGGEGAVPRRGDCRPREDQRTMTWPEAAELVSRGFDIGSHTLTHPDLAGLEKAGAEKEIRGSRRLLRERLGSPVEFFCYPRGSFSRETMAIAAEAGYRGAVATFPWRLGPRFDCPGRRPDRFALPRVGVYRHTGRAQFRLKTAAFLQWGAR